MINVVHKGDTRIRKTTDTLVIGDDVMDILGCDGFVEVETHDDIDGVDPCMRAYVHVHKDHSVYAPRLGCGGFMLVPKQFLLEIREQLVSTALVDFTMDIDTEHIGQLVYRVQNFGMELNNKEYVNNVSVQTNLEQMMDALRVMWDFKNTKREKPVIYLAEKFRMGHYFLLHTTALTEWSNVRYIRTKWSTWLQEVRDAFDTYAHIKLADVETNYMVLQWASLLNVLRGLVLITKKDRQKRRTKSTVLRAQLAQLAEKWRHVADSVVPGWDNRERRVKKVNMLQRKWRQLQSTEHTVRQEEIHRRRQLELQVYHDHQTEQTRLYRIQLDKDARTEEASRSAAKKQYKMNVHSVRHRTDVILDSEDDSDDDAWMSNATRRSELASLREGRRREVAFLVANPHLNLRSLSDAGDQH